jgi:tetratricopeptide (TPR) repeat protein
LRASVRASLGQHAEALRLAGSARQRWYSLGNEKVPPGFDGIEGEVLRKAGRAEEAIPCLKRAISAYTESDNDVGVAETELELALTLRDLGDPDARTHANRARELFQAQNLPLRAGEVSELTGET